MELGVGTAASRLRAGTSPADGRSPSGRPPDHSLGTRLAWITGLRLAFLLLLFAATATLYLRNQLSSYPFSLRVTFIAIAAGFGLAAAYATALRAGARLQELAWAQLALDQVTWTAFVYVTGGPSSGATTFYALTCLVGAVLVGIRGAFFSAGLGMALYVALCAALHFGWVAPPLDQAPTEYSPQTAELVFPVLLNALGIIVVALLGGYLAERLRLTGGALNVATRRANEAERLAVLGRIAAGLAHEIRNPLGSITGSIEMLRESAAMSDDDRVLCDIIKREARRLNDLVGDMVDLSTPRAPKPEATDVAALARDVVALARNATRASDVRVEYVGPPGETLARCDGAQIRQVLWNLVRNAVQATSAGSRVTVRLTLRDHEATLAVDDEGPGIPEDAAARIFEDFFTTRTHGAGIGLAVVRRIVDDHAAMGVRLAVERAPTGGASFCLTLKRDVAGLRRSNRPPPP